MARSLSILLAGNNSWLLKSVKDLIQTTPGLRLLGECNLSEVIDQARQTMPEVIVILAGISLLTYREIFLTLQMSHPNTKLIVTTPLETSYYQGDPLAASFAVIIQEKNLSLELIPALLKTVYTGGGVGDEP